MFQGEDRTAMDSLERISVPLEVVTMLRKFHWTYASFPQAPLQELLSPQVSLLPWPQMVGADTVEPH